LLEVLSVVGVGAVDVGEVNSGHFGGSFRPLVLIL
jgi:hypothetical protein